MVDRREMGFSENHEPGPCRNRRLRCEWNIERCFQESKSQLGLDRGEIRMWRGRHPHITMVMAVHAPLTGLRRPQNRGSEYRITAYSLILL